MEDVRKIIVFRIGLESFGVEICHVRRVVRNTDRFPVSDSYLGMTDTSVDYGNIPIFNIHQYLNIAPLPSFGGFFIIIDLDNSFVAIPVDDVENCYSISADCLEMIPPVIKNFHTQYLKYFFNLGTRLIPIIDSNRLLR